MKKGVYLCSCKALHSNYDIDYNDIIKFQNNINILGDCLEIDLTKYDYIIATPPCNYYSRGNYRRNLSKYALATKHLLPDLLIKLGELGKPFIIENVRNEPLFKNCGIFEITEKLGIFVYFYGRHTYFTNTMINFNGIPQQKDNIQNGCVDGYRQGGSNVHAIIEYWLEYIGA